MNRPRSLTPLRALLLSLLLLGQASALRLVIMDRDNQTALGKGESAGGRVVLELVPDYNGPVKVFVTDDNGDVQKLSGTLRAGQITLDAPQNTSLAKFLAARGLGLQAQPSSTQPFSLPGLKTDPTDKTPTLPTDKIKNAVPAVPKKP
jgi:hypothetical protein